MHFNSNHPSLESQLKYPPKDDFTQEDAQTDSEEECSPVHIHCIKVDDTLRRISRQYDISVIFKS